MKPELPDWTWQLEAGDMCLGRYDDCGDRHCLIGWLAKWVAASDMFYFGTDVRQLLAEICGNPSGGVENYNDTHTLDHNARVWNTAMRRLGYDIDKGACL